MHAAGRYSHGHTAVQQAIDTGAMLIQVQYSTCYIRLVYDTTSNVAALSISYSTNLACISIDTVMYSSDTACG